MSDDNGVKIDFDELNSFIDKINSAAQGGFAKASKLFLEGIGNEFLRILEDEIIRRKVMDTRLLLNSFHKGDDSNVCKMSQGGMSLEVGTNVEYAKFVNGGHWTNKKGEKGRFVPGEWKGDRFVYIKGHNSGMYLKQQWVEGAHYWEASLEILEKMFPDLVKAMYVEWLENYFSEFI